MLMEQCYCCMWAVGDMMGRWESLKKRIKDQTSKKSMLAGLEPTRITPNDFESIALTTRPQHLFIPVFYKTLYTKMLS